jgi:hypothetical protein
VYDNPVALLVPSVSQCLALAGPILSVVGIIWFWRHGDAVIARLFPSLKWERELGWLNLRAHRRADQIMRGLTHVLHLVLLGALAGILGLSWMIGQPHDMDTVAGAFSIPFEFIDLTLFLGIWIVYFAYALAPRLRAEYEEAELRRFRAENPNVEEEWREDPKDRLKISLWETDRPQRRRF